jgi:hypothetical protein
MENSVNASATFIVRDTLARNSSTNPLKSSRVLVSTVSLKSPWRIRIARAVLAFVVGVDPSLGLHASYSASTSNRALAISFFVSYNVLGKGKTGRSVSPDTPFSTMGLAGRNDGDTGGGSDCRASALFKTWKLPSGVDKTISSTAAPSMSMALSPCTVDNPFM